MIIYPDLQMIKFIPRKLNKKYFEQEHSLCFF